jgi:hypothetical protein
MKPIVSARIVPHASLVFATWSLSATALAQQAPAPVEPPSAPAVSTAPASSSPVAATASAATTAAATPTATPAASATPANGDAAVVPAQNQPAAATTAPTAPTTGAYADLPPLPPIASLEPKKEKKGKKGKKGRKAPAFGSDNDGDVEWGDPWGDSQDELKAAGLSFRFLLQAHYRQSFGESKNVDRSYHLGEENLLHHNDGWYVNRLFWRLAAEPSKYVGYKMLLDMAEFQHNNGKQAIKQAYVALRPVPKHLHFLVGVLKLPYSIAELDPIAKYEFTKMGDANDLVKGMGFAGRDIGAEVVVSPLAKPKHLTLALGLFRGHAHDENASLIGAIGGRAESYPVKGLRLGIDFMDMPKTERYRNPFETGSKNLLPNPEDPRFPYSQTWLKGHAFSGDITFTRWKLMLRTEGMIGTRIDNDTLYHAKKFGAVWAIAAYRFPVGNFELQPALRAEWLDTDLDQSNGMRRTLAAGVAAYFVRSVRLLVDVARQDVQAQSPYIDQPLPLQAVPYNALSNTCVTGQVQVTL